MQNKNFWKTTPLKNMTEPQWESLCDKCGKCCLLKLEDAETYEIFYTDIGCKLLDCKTARCRDYQNRKKHVPDCIVLSMDNLSMLSWMPQSCAYRLLFEGKDLPEWHPLVTGDSTSTKKAGHSVADKVFSETEIEKNNIPDHIFEW